MRKALLQIQKFLECSSVKSSCEEDALVQPPLFAGVHVSVLLKNWLQCWLPESPAEPRTGQEMAGWLWQSAPARILPLRAQSKARKQRDYRYWTNAHVPCTCLSTSGRVLKWNTSFLTFILKSKVWPKPDHENINFCIFLLFFEPFLIHQRALLSSQCSENCPKLTIPGFPHNLLPVSFCDIGFLKKGIGQVLALLPFFCSLLTILLSDLVGYSSLLQIVMAVWRKFFLIWSVRHSHYSIVCTRLPPLTQQLKY